RRRIRRELSSQGQDRGGRAVRAGQQGCRHHRGSRQDRPDRRREDLRLQHRRRRAHPHRRDRRSCPVMPAPSDRSNTMTLKRLSRVGLVALAVIAVIGLFLALSSFFDQSYAQTPPPAAPPEPEPPTPNCDAKMLINCTPNSGDTAWMLTSMALVLMMTIPGLGLFYGGMVRKKN